MRTEYARIADLNEESTVTGSLASNSDKSDIGESDGERRTSAKVPEPTSHGLSEEGRERTSGDISGLHFLSSAALWLGPERPEPHALPMTKLLWQ